jgi:hypothetical protein
MLMTLMRFSTASRPALSTCSRKPAELSAESIIAGQAFTNSYTNCFGQALQRPHATALLSVSESINKGVFLMLSNDEAHTAHCQLPMFKFWSEPKPPKDLFFLL